jgi:hypothetical protein
MSKTLVIYSYFEKNDEYIKNLEFFIQNAIYDDIDYIFCINGHECSVDIPKQSNIKIISRDNKNFDFGAYDDAIQNIDINIYNYYFFINTSVRGPFLPNDQRKSIRWTEPFIKLLSGDVKLVGTSINILNITDPEIQKSISLDLLVEKGYTPPFIHVQSQVFLLNKESLQFLISKQFFNQTNETDFIKFIALREVLMSQLILKNGWNINCILPKYQGLDYRIIKNDINSNSVDGDPYYPNAYFGGDIKPYDVIFIKTNRGVSTNEIIKLTDQYYIYNTNKTNYVEPFSSDGNYYKSLYIRKKYLGGYGLTILSYIIIFFIVFVIFWLFRKDLKKIYKRLLKLI